METLVFRVVYLVFLPDCFYTSLFSMVCLIFWIFIVYSFFLAVYLVFVMAKLVFRVFCVFGISTLSRDLQLPSLVVGLASKVLLRVLLQVLRHKLLPGKCTNCDIKKWKWSVHFDQAWPYGLGVEKCIWNASRRWIFSTLNGRWIVDSRIYFFKLVIWKPKKPTLRSLFFEPNKSKGCFDACFHRKFANVFRKNFSWFFISPLPLPPPPYEQDHDAADETTKEENHPHSNQKDLIKEDNVNFASSQNAGNTEGECKARTAIGKRKYRRLMRLSPELWEIPAPDPSSFSPPLTKHFVWKMHQNPLTNHFVWN